MMTADDRQADDNQASSQVRSGQVSVDVWLKGKGSVSNGKRKKERKRVEEGFCEKCINSKVKVLPGGWL